jgi:UDP-GlcNAc:undecaprenyl-phosphate/decaprenyl-phosphate GlcNAc-1-phosphate transferase
MYEILAFFLSIVLTGVLYYFMQPIINSTACIRSNYRGNPITSIGGILFIVPLIILTIINFVLYDADLIKLPLSNIAVFLVLGFGFLGLIDDLIGNRDVQGFKGHILSIFKGKLTTGGLKLFGGPLLCLLAFLPDVKNGGYIYIFSIAIFISLIANLTNLFDLAPGRSLKLSIITLVIFGIIANVTNHYGAVGILLVLLYFDLKEYIMLGDIGSNAIGAYIGTVLAINMNQKQLYIAIVIVLFFNLMSEFISFSKIIQSFIPLRILDGLGQSIDRKEWIKKKS